MEEKDVVEKGKLNRKFIILAIIIVIIIILSTICLYYYYYIFGSEGELELTVEVMDENIMVNTTFQLKCTLINTGNNGLRLVDPLVDKAKRSELGQYNILIKYPNGTYVRKSSYVAALTIPQYYYNDLIILSSGKSIEYYVNVNADFYEFDVLGTYSLKVSYISDNTTELKVAMWTGYVRSEEIDVVIT